MGRRSADTRADRTPFGAGCGGVACCAAHAFLLQLSRRSDVAWNRGYEPAANGRGSRCSELVIRAPDRIGRTGVPLIIEEVHVDGKRRQAFETREAAAIDVHALKIPRA